MRQHFNQWLYMVLLSILLTGCGIKFHQQISTTKSVENIRIKVSEAKGIYWDLSLINNNKGYVKILWDESAYVDTQGISSRLIREDNHKRLDQAQPPSPVPSGSTFSTKFTSEALLKKGKIKPAHFDKTAKLYMALEVNGRRFNWEAKIYFHKDD